MKTIYVDIDGVCIDFMGTAAAFGIEMKPNVFYSWRWGGRNPSVEEFYAAAEFQPWFGDLMLTISLNGFLPVFLTKGNVRIKRDFMINNTKPSNCDWSPLSNLSFFAALNKAEYCKSPSDMLIDDNIDECKAWRDRGGIAWHFDLASVDPFGDFIEYWVRKTPAREGK